MQEVVVLQVSVPIMQRRSANGNPHECAHEIHNRIRQLTSQKLIRIIAADNLRLTHLISHRLCSVVPKQYAKSCTAV